MPHAKNHHADLTRISISPSTAPATKVRLSMRNAFICLSKKFMRLRAERTKCWNRLSMTSQTCLKCLQLCGSLTSSDETWGLRSISVVWDCGSLSNQRVILVTDNQFPFKILNFPTSLTNDNVNLSIMQIKNSLTQVFTPLPYLCKSAPKSGQLSRRTMCCSP